MASFSAGDRRIQDIIRRIEKNLAGREQADLEISHDIELLKRLAIPEGESETVEETDMGRNRCPRCNESEGKSS
jgi:hypothetical protein